MMKRWIDRNVFGLFMLVVCTGGLVDKYQTHSTRGMIAWAVLLVLSALGLWRHYHHLRPKVLGPVELAELRALRAVYDGCERPQVHQFFRRHPAALHALYNTLEDVSAKLPKGARVALVDQFGMGTGETSLRMVFMLPMAPQLRQQWMERFAFWWLSEPRPYPLCVDHGELEEPPTAWAGRA